LNHRTVTNEPALFSQHAQTILDSTVTNSFSHFFQGEGRIPMDGMNTAERYGIGRSVGTGMKVNPSANLLNAKLDVQHFRLLAQTKPRTKAGQVRQVWPEIKAALGAGHRLKDIRQWLSEVGVEIGYARLSDYVGQLKRREAGLVAATAIPAAGKVAVVQDKSSVSHRRARSNMGSDPLSNLQEHERRPALFAFNPEPDAKKLI
jgi:hypothetical protein